MTVSRIDLHPHGGIAGDMFAAAVFDAWPELYPAFIADIDQLNIAGLSTSLQARLSCGLSAKHFTVIQQVQEKPPRTLAAVQEFLIAKPIEPAIAKIAADIYALLAKAEAAVHGKSIDTIHFHEVSDWDSMVDIIAAAGVIKRLDCECWRLAPLPLGGGTINTAHGDIPLPAPATVELLQNYEWIDDGQPGERVTPTGAAIVAYLNPVPMSGSTTAAKLVASGAGCGSREFADRANILRVTAFSGAGGENIINDTVYELAFEIDDMTGEELAWALDALREQSAVIDASSISMQGKKGRHCVGVRLLVTPQQRDEVIDHCFTLCTTLGVRYQQVNRSTLKRHHEVVDGARLKFASRPQGQVTAKVESDDLARATGLDQRRRQAIEKEHAARSKDYGLDNTDEQN